MGERWILGGSFCRRWRARTSPSPQLWRLIFMSAPHLFPTPCATVHQFFGAFCTVHLNTDCRNTHKQWNISIIVSSNNETNVTVCIQQPWNSYFAAEYREMFCDRCLLLMQISAMNCYSSCTLTSHFKGSARIRVRIKSWAEYLKVTEKNGRKAN